MPRAIRPIRLNLTTTSPQELQDDPEGMVPYQRLEPLNLMGFNNSTTKTQDDPYIHFRCANCNQDTQQLRFEPNFSIKDKGQICQDCADKMSKCSNCGYHYKATKQYGERNYCEDCYKRYFTACPLCMNTIQANDLLTLQDGIRKVKMCGSCFEKNYALCIECGSGEKKSKLIHCKTCNNYSHSSTPCYTTHMNGYINSCRRMNTYTFYPGKEKGKIVTVDRFVGVELEAEGGDPEEMECATLPDNVLVGTDGSLDETGVEVRTPPASLDKLEDIIKKTASKMRAYDYRGTTSAGCHVHIGLKDVRDGENAEENIRHIVKTFFAIEDIIFSMIPPSRWDNHYCQSLFKGYTFKNFAEKQVDNVWYRDTNWKEKRERKMRHGDDTRYSGLNLHSLYFRGTIEFRYHSGTVSAEKILSWAQFLLLLIDYSLKRYNESEVLALYNMETSEEKVDKLFDLIHAAPSLQRYIKRRIQKFNPGLKIKFNKGKHTEMTKEEFFAKNKAEFLNQAIKNFNYHIRNWSLDPTLITEADKQKYIERSIKSIAREMWESEQRCEKGFILSDELSSAVREVARQTSRANEEGEDVE